MKIFVGIGAGPIQTGIFVSGAHQRFDRIVIADVDADLINAVRNSRSISVNTACSDRIKTDTYDNIEALNPQDSTDLPKLIRAAGDATAVCTALPSTAFYRHIASWLGEAFRQSPDRSRYIYTAENSTTAAEDLQEELGSFPHTHYLNTVIGKMSKVFADEPGLKPLTTGLSRGHLVEEYNHIYTDDAPGIDTVGIQGLHPTPNLEPFEAAKLYGHNTSHFMLGELARSRGCTYVNQASAFPKMISNTVTALLEECGAALNRKYGTEEPFVTPTMFTPFALQLVARMLSPLLKDSVDRVIRDPERKLGWNDRMIGAVRLCREQGIAPTQLLKTAAATCRRCFGNATEVSRSLADLWRDAPQEDAEDLIEAVCRQV